MVNINQVQVLETPSISVEEAEQAFIITVCTDSTPGHMVLYSPSGKVIDTGPRIIDACDSHSIQKSLMTESGNYAAFLYNDNNVVIDSAGITFSYNPPSSNIGYVVAAVGVVAVAGALIYLSTRLRR